MSLFCLVHGSAQGPSGWKLLAGELETQGHRVVCTDLPVQHPTLAATDYAGLIGASLEREAESAVVVAHSASGLFLPIVPQFARVSRLVYLAAVIPLPGESFLGQYQADPTMYRPEFAGKNPTVSEELALQFMFHDCAPEVARWGLTTVRLMYAKQAISEVCPLAAMPAAPSTYISCRLDRTINPDWWERAARQRLGVEPVLMEAGHFPHVSRPGELARILTLQAD